MHELLQAVIEAATWIEKVNPRFEDNFYRSEVLRPDGYLMSNHSEYSAACFYSVGRKRRRELQQLGISLLTENEVVNSGKLVLAAPADSVLDGASAAESGGYFDDYELAAWDTWVALGTALPAFPKQEKYVVSWVPEHLLSQVQSSIDVNFLGNISWLDRLSFNPLTQPMLNLLIAAPKGIESVGVPYDEQLKQRMAIINNKRVAEPW